MKTNKHPKVSVITVSFNAVKEIEKTILSVLNQTYDNIEYIIIDGGSTDGTVDIIKKYADRIAYWVSEPDGGIYFGMNKGIKVATGEWINFMNAGDLFYSKYVVEKVFTNEYLQKTKVIYGDVYKVIGSKSKLIKGMPIRCIRKTMPCCHQSEFVKAYNKIEIMFRADKYKLAADYDVLYRIYFKYGEDSISIVNCAIAIFDGQGVSTTKKRLVFREDIDIRKEHKNFRWYWDHFKDSVKKILYKD